MEVPTSVADALKHSIPLLESSGVETPRLDAQLLLAWAVGGRREDLARSPEQPLTARQQIIFSKAISLRAQRRPLPYITGEAPFYGRFFKVNRAVLIPRPETELLVELARSHSEHSAGGGEFRVADIGTGSGCIAVTIACEIAGARVVATDISPLALRIADKNMRRHAVADRIDLREGSLCTVLSSAERFDAIVANPPYIELAESRELMPEVRDYEPALALYGVENSDCASEAQRGLPRRLRRELFEQARDHLVAGGVVAVEIGAGHATAAIEDARDLGYRQTDIVDDAAGTPRVVIGYL